MVQTRRELERRGSVKPIDSFIRKAVRGARPAFILGVSANGLSFIRSLGRRGIPVLALDSHELPGTYSRYCVKAILPDPVENESTWLGFLIRTAERLGRRGVIIPTSDALVLFVSRNRDELRPHFDFSLAEENVLEDIADKKRQYQLAEKCGVPIPTTYFPGNLEELRSIAGKMTYPCILKPHTSHLWRGYVEKKRKMAFARKKLAEVATPEELVATYGEMAKSRVGIMVQERIPGGDDQFYGMLTYFGEGSEPLAIFTKRKLRQTGLGYGDGSFQISIWVPEVAELSIKLLKHMNYRGLAGVEFKKDPRDGVFKLIEINPRSVTGEWMAVRSGVDIPYIAYLDSMGESVERVVSFEEGVKWVSLEWDFKTFLAYRRRGMLSFWGWIASLRGKRCYAIWSWRDPIPFAILSIHLLKVLLRKVLHLALRRRSR